jgi:hypothetical protein
VEEMVWFMNWRQPVQCVGEHKEFPLKSVLAMLITNVHYGEQTYSCSSNYDEAVKAEMKKADELCHDLIISDDPAQRTRQKMFLVMDGLPARFSSQSGYKNPYQTLCDKYILLMGCIIGISILCLLVQIVIDPASANYDLLWFVFEMIFTAIFATEFVIRFTICTAFLDPKMDGYLDLDNLKEHLESEVHARITFWKDPFNIVDIVAIVPGVLSLIFRVTGNNNALKPLRIVRLVRLARFVRMRRAMEQSAVSAKIQDTIGAIMVVLAVILFIYMKEGLPQ